MKTEETNKSENNRLIAEFMGWNKGENYSNEFQFYEAWGESVDQVTPKEMQFHNSWDWLMEVVEKIESLQPEGYNTLIEGTMCWIECEDNTFEGNASTKIESTYYAVVEFIKWYNENSAKNN